MRGGCTPGNSRLWQLASLVLIKRLTRVRGGCTPGSSRLGQLAALVLIKRLAHVRGPVPGLSIRARGRRLNAAPVQEKNARARGLHPGQFAPMAARFTRAHQKANSRARGLHPRQVAPWAARSARAHQEASARARRRRVKVSSTFSKVAGELGAAPPRSYSVSKRRRG